MIIFMLTAAAWVVGVIAAIPILAGFVELLASFLRWLFRTKRWRHSRRLLLHRKGWDA